MLVRYCCYCCAIWVIHTGCKSGFELVTFWEIWEISAQAHLQMAEEIIARSIRWNRVRRFSPSWELFNMWLQNRATKGSKVAGSPLSSSKSRRTTTRAMTTKSSSQLNGYVCPSWILNPQPPHIFLQSTESTFSKIPLIGAISLFVSFGASFKVLLNFLTVIVFPKEDDCFQIRLHIVLNIINWRKLKLYSSIRSQTGNAKPTLIVGLKYQLFS